LEIIYDLIGIGIGPFNLGLAALAASIPDFNCIFFDQNPEFNWHPGLLMDNTRLQVPFLADLVTLADPSNPFTYVWFLKSMNRLTRFAIHENYYPTRKEYTAYCQWVAAQLNALNFGMHCEEIHYDKRLDCYQIRVVNGYTRESKLFHGKHLAIGIGTTPNIPDCVKDLKKQDSNAFPPNIFHSSEYLFRKPALRLNTSITIVGSGQSAAEIFYDLLQSQFEIETLNWFTRTDRFYPMEYSKLTLEMSSPDYIEYFYSLSAEKKAGILAGQAMLYKGINFGLINAIYDELYRLSLEDRKSKESLQSNCELKSVSVNPDGSLDLRFYHTQMEKPFKNQTDTLILATGYEYGVPSFLEPVKELIQWTSDGFYQINRNYSIDRNNRIFVQNADLHSHGFNSADLGMGPYRNGIILNSILCGEQFKLEKNIAFQQFG